MPHSQESEKNESHTRSSGYRTDKRMADLADMYKTEGKKMYMLQHYDL